MKMMASRLPTTCSYLTSVGDLRACEAVAGRGRGVAVAGPDLKAYEDDEISILVSWAFIARILECRGTCVTIRPLSESTCHECTTAPNI